MILCQVRLYSCTLVGIDNFRQRVGALNGSLPSPALFFRCRNIIQLLKCSVDFFILSFRYRLDVHRQRMDATVVVYLAFIHRFAFWATDFNFTAQFCST